MHRGRLFRTIGIGSAVSAVALMAACAPQAANSSGGNAQPSAVSTTVGTEKVTLRFLDYDQGPDAVYMKKVIAGFEQKYPNITIQRTEQSFDQVMSTLNLRLSDPNGPDVATINNGWQSMGTLSKAGLVLNLDKYAAAYGWRSQMPSTMQQQLEFSTDGKHMGVGSLYGLPGARLTTVGLYYNKKLLQQAGLTPPTTWPEFTADLPKIKQHGLTPLLLGTQEKTFATNPLFAVQSELGAKDKINGFVYGIGDTKLNQTGIDTAAQTLVDWQKAGYLNSDAAGLTLDSSRSAFTSGKAVFHFDYSGFLAGSTSNEQNFGRLQLPQPDTGDQTSVGGASGVFAIAAKTKHPDAAAAFLNFVDSKPMNELAVSMGYLPIQNVSTKPPAGTAFADEVSGAATVTAANGFLPFFDWASPDMLDVIGGQVQLILAGKSTPADLVTKGQQSYDSAAAKRG